MIVYNWESNKERRAEAVNTAARQNLTKTESDRESGGEEAWDARLRPRGPPAAHGPREAAHAGRAGSRRSWFGEEGGERNRPGRVPPARGAGPIPRREARVETRVLARAAAEVSVDVRPRGSTVQVLCLPI